MDNRKIGEFITKIRKQKNLTQKELADILGITDKAISKWERGAGYPDIGLLKPLAEALGVTVSELLEGEVNTAPESEPLQAQAEHSDQLEERTSRTLLNALSYTDQLIRQKENRIGNIIAISLGLLLFLAIFTCMIVDLAITHQFTWSRIVIVCCVFSGCLLLPPFLSKKHGLLYSLSLLTILIFPFLGSLYRFTATSTGHTEVLWKMEFPIAFLWVAFLWLTLLLVRKTSMNAWFKAGIIMLGCIPCDLITNQLADHMFAQGVYSSFDLLEDVITVFGFIFIAVIFFFIGKLRSGQLRSQD